MPRDKKHFAVIGLGVTGLTVAYRLTKKGHKVTCFDKSNHVGGNNFSYVTSDYSVPLAFSLVNPWLASQKYVDQLNSELGLEDSHLNILSAGGLSTFHNYTNGSSLGWNTVIYEFFLVCVYIVLGKGLDWLPDSRWLGPVMYINLFASFADRHTITPETLRHYLLFVLSQPFWFFYARGTRRNEILTDALWKRIESNAVTKLNTEVTLLRKDGTIQTSDGQVFRFDKAFVCIQPCHIQDMASVPQPLRSLVTVFRKSIAHVVLHTDPAIYKQIYRDGRKGLIYCTCSSAGYTFHLNPHIFYNLERAPANLMLTLWYEPDTPTTPSSCISRFRNVVLKKTFSLSVCTDRGSLASSLEEISKGVVVPVDCSYHLLGWTQEGIQHAFEATAQY